MMSLDPNCGYYQATPEDTEWALELGHLNQRQAAIDEGINGLEEGIHPAIVLARLGLASDISVARSVLDHMRQDFDFGCINELVPGRQVRLDYKPLPVAVVYSGDETQEQILPDASKYLQMDLLRPVKDFVDNEVERKVRDSKFADTLTRTYEYRQRALDQISEPLSSSRKHISLLYSEPFYGDHRGELGSGITLLSTYDAEAQPCVALTLGGEMFNRSEQTGAFNTLRFAHLSSRAHTIVETAALAVNTARVGIPTALQGILSSPFEPEDPSGLTVVAFPRPDASSNESIDDQASSKYIKFSRLASARLFGTTTEGFPADELVQAPATEGWSGSARVFLPADNIDVMQREHLLNLGHLMDWTWTKPLIKEALGVVSN